jgi:ATP-binding protein involved in chromosome partitioning
MTEFELRVQQRLAHYVDPNTGVDLVSSKAIAGVGVSGSQCAVEIVLNYPAETIKLAFSKAVQEHLLGDLAITAASVSVSWRIWSHKVQSELTPLPGVKNIIAVASGKGGVGKSTTAVNLALALSREGARVGILDADIYGPSQPMMLGVSGPLSQNEDKIEPKRNHGLQIMSIGFAINEDTPVVWRGPMVTQALTQMLQETAWDDLDYLVIDLPPGTGDIQLTLCQRVPVSGALIVTTPQDIALIDAKKALKMFEKVAVPVLGLVENMSVFCCPNCGVATPIFGSGGGAQMAADYGIPMLAQLPLDGRIRELSDRGEPPVIAEPEGAPAQLYLELARKLAARLGLQARSRKIGLPNIMISAS